MTLQMLLILLVKTSVITLMVSLGLGLQLNTLALFRHRPWLILRSLLGTCVLVPLVALVLLKLPMSSEMSAGARFGIALMALCPSAPLTLRKADRQGGDFHLAALLQVAAALVAVVTIPLLTDVFRATYQVQGWNIAPKTVAAQVALVQVLPLTAGLMLSRWFPQIAARWAIPIQKTANLVNLAVVGLIVFMVFPKVLSFAEENLVALAAMVIMTFAALSIGYALGGANSEERTTTAVVTSMRNPGLALLFATTHGKDVSGIKLAILTYLLVTILGSIPFYRWSKAQGIA
ncbi:MAG: bile acid:sodium symporter [Cyanobacteriota bacterium]|jgi:BASS family bile acid:Na+ symporter